MLTAIKKYANRKDLIYPLVTFRVLFGLMLFFGTLRFYFKGWIEEFYINPKLHFTYYGFEWVKPISGTGMYLLFIAMGLSFLFLSLGLFYRLASVSAFLTFTYVELIDKTFYLNHYYFVSLILFLLIFVPANAAFSLDLWRNPSIKRKLLPSWCLDIFKFQLIIVYFFAGIAKLNAEWLLEAMPLRIWLKAFTDLPLIGNLFQETTFAYFMSWTGAAYDLIIPFLLLSKRFKTLGFSLVIAFHLITACLFPIGMFPYIMIISSLIFMNPNSHKVFWNKLFYEKNRESGLPVLSAKRIKMTTVVLTTFFVLQLAMPLRHLLYPGNLFWTEQGYRFSWRVMLMEKAGYAIFEVYDRDGRRKWEVNNSDFLEPVQEKMMATQSDMILQFAKMLRNEYKSRGKTNIEIRVKSFVSLNGHSSRLMIDPEVNLLTLSEGLAPKDWITTFN